MNFPRTAEDDTVLSNSDIAAVQQRVAQADDGFSILLQQAAVRCAELNDGADVGMTRGEFIRFYCDNMIKAMTA